MRFLSRLFKKRAVEFEERPRVIPARVGRINSAKIGRAKRTIVGEFGDNRSDSGAP